MTRLCTRCVYGDDIEKITFDEHGVCSYCKIHDEFDALYPQGAEGTRILNEYFEKIKNDGKGKKADCIIGVSGGCDSSYLLHTLVKAGLRPVAVHFDNTWNSEVASQNIHKVVSKLNIPLYTKVVNNKEYDDIYNSFLNSGIRDLESPTDIALATTLYEAAEKYGVKWIINGHSFRTEGISPLGWLYMDGKLIESVHNQFGKLKRKTYPNLTLFRFIRWSLMGFNQLRPLYYMEYDKEKVKNMLAETYGWQWYGGHHLENRFTAFYHTYFLFRRWGIDTRRLELSAFARTGVISHNEAVSVMNTPREYDENILSLVKSRLKYSEDEFERLMNLPKRHYTEFKTYKKTFERMKPFFWLMLKWGRIPKSFYTKFCNP